MHPPNNPALRTWEVVNPPHQGNAFRKGQKVQEGPVPLSCLFNPPPGVALRRGREREREGVEGESMEQLNLREGT